MEPDIESPEEAPPPPPQRIFPNGAICDRCDCTLSTRSILGAFVCVECMTDDERLSFPTLNEPEFMI